MKVGHRILGGGYRGGPCYDPCPLSLPERLTVVHVSQGVHLGLVRVIMPCWEGDMSVLMVVATRKTAHTNPA